MRRSACVIDTNNNNKTELDQKSRSCSTHVISLVLHQYLHTSLRLSTSTQQLDDTLAFFTIVILGTNSEPPQTPSVPYFRDVRWVLDGAIKCSPIMLKGTSLSDGCTVHPIIVGILEGARIRRVSTGVTRVC